MELVICEKKNIEEKSFLNDLFQLVIDSPKEIPVEYNKKCLECLMFEKPCKLHNKHIHINKILFNKKINIYSYKYLLI